MDAKGVRMSETATGYVYVLGNAGMDGLFKVGRTTGDPHLRAKQLSASPGVPEEFDVLFSIKAPIRFLAAVEREAHRLLDEHRFNLSREFFGCSPSTAVEAVREAFQSVTGQPAPEGGW